MKKYSGAAKLFTALFAFIIAVVMVAGSTLPAAAAEKAPELKVFSSPEDAAKSLENACKNNDEKALLEMFGQIYEKVVNSTDKNTDKANRKKLADLLAEKVSFRKQIDNDNIVTIIVGEMEYPFPIPLIKENSGWKFDIPLGLQEIVNRRIGRNELAAIGVCNEFVKAQKEYAAKDHDGDKVLEYACKFVSTHGKKDGLYWATGKDGETSPFGPMAEKVKAAGVKKQDGKNPTFFGYHFKILTGQGSNAPGGKHDYIVNGNMIAGYAMVAYPAVYGKTGVMTFMVNQLGVVYEKDLGKNTVETAGKMDSFNPDKTWLETKE
ncbi:MAG: DUF2950 domain-containing protein [Firmicutes bacterium]|nr:DUF2950 domain-containing protein [Bacillota bacterium]